MLSIFKEKFAGMLLDTIVHVNVKLKEAAVLGKPVSAYDKYCRGSKDYFSLAKELITIEKTQTAETEEEKTFTLEEVAEAIKSQGLEPVWKDWDRMFSMDFGEATR